MKLKLSQETVENLKTLERAILDETGAYELPNPTPMVVNVNRERPLSLQEQIKRCMAGMSRDMASQGEETFEEFNDFEIEDEEPTLSEFQVEGMTPDWPVQPEEQDDESLEPAPPGSQPENTEIVQPDETE
jgi:hypothetical protein